MIEFGEKIKHLREEKGMTQQTMADCLYVTRQAVSRWECGARYPDLLTTKRIAEVLETSIDELVSGEELKRDVEKEPILMTPVSNCIQTILYTVGAVSYLIMGISWFLICFCEAQAYTPFVRNWRDVVSDIFFTSGYGISLAAMAAGIYYSVKNELSPRKTGIIMSAGFLLLWLTFVGTCFITVFAGNGEIAPVTWIILAGNVAAVIIVNSFFSARRQVSPIPVYTVAMVLLLLEGWHFSQMLMADEGDAYQVDDFMRITVLLISTLGQIAVAGLLMYQAYTLDRKRKQSTC